MQKIQTNIMNKLICRRITFNYSFLSETILFNVGAKDLQTSHAKINLTFAVDILHFDGNGCILARYRVRCIFFKKLFYIRNSHILNFIYSTGEFSAELRKFF